MSSYTGSLSDIQAVTIAPLLVSTTDQSGGGSVPLPPYGTIPYRGGSLPPVGMADSPLPAGTSQAQMNLPNPFQVSSPPSPEYLKAQKYLVVVIVTVLIITAIGLMRKR